MTTYQQRLARRHALNRMATAQVPDPGITPDHRVARENGPKPPTSQNAGIAAGMIIFLLVVLGLGLWLFL